MEPHGSDEGLFSNWKNLDQSAEALASKCVNAI